MSWRPLLEGVAGERALRIALEIGEELCAPPPPWTFEDAPEQHKIQQPASLSGGKTGLGLVLAYLSHSLGRKDFAEVAFGFLSEAADTLASSRMSASLYGGFAGLGWVVAHLRGGLLDFGAEDPDEEIDRALLDYLDSNRQQVDYDLIGGLVGLGVYALERLPLEAGAQLLQRVIDRLGESAKSRPEGVAWFTPQELLPPHQRQECPEGHFNLGVAHGTPGVASLLGLALAAGVGGGKARNLLREAVHWTLSQALGGADGRVRFPYYIATGVKPVPSRSAWCYGDPGIAAALYCAARGAGEPEWERRALEIALGVAGLPMSEAGVQDAGLCHGAAGLGHLYNRMFQASGEPRLAEAARAWYEKTMDMRRPGEGAAGYLTWGPMRLDGPPVWVTDPGLLSGAAGIALALLAAATPVEPLWDRILLSAIPPRIVT